MSEPKQTLFGIVAQSNAITQMIIEADGELTPEVEAQLNHVDLELAEKVDGYGIVMDRMVVEADYWKQRAEIYLKIAKSHARIQERIKENLKNAMLSLGKTEVKGNDIRFKLASSQPRLVLEEGRLTEAFLMEVRTLVPDKERIRTELKSGATVQGAELIPSYSLRQYANKKDAV